MESSRPLNFAVPGLALGLMLMAAGCDRQSGEQAQPQPGASAPAAAGAPEGGGGGEVLTGTIDRSHKGEPLPDITLKDPAGNTLALNELEGPVLINLWATWCAPCVTELPLLDKLATDRAGSLRVLTVSQDMADGATVARFLEDKGVSKLEPWLDPENELAFRFGGGTLPTTIYYDADGREVWRYVGGHDWTSAETAAMLAEGA